MDTANILTEAKSKIDTPYGWIVLPLQRHKVILAIFGWVIGVIIGSALFAGVASVTIPHNYEYGFFAAFFTSLLLAILLFVALGSLWCLFVDVRRLLQSDTHIIVITPQDFVKQEGSCVTHVPLLYVRHVTGRGRAIPLEDTSKEQNRQAPSAGENVMGFFGGRAFSSMSPSGLKRRRQRMRTPTSLAFIDGRTDTEVVVVSDAAYGDPVAIADLLKEYVIHVQEM